MVSKGSEATFSVREKLVRLPLPNDAVMRTAALAGEVHLDGRASAVEIDLHQLSSDAQFRDRYVRQRMFPNDRTAVFTVNDLGALPDGFSEGEVVTAQVEGLLTIRGVEVPLVFDVEARDDGDVVFVVGRTQFTWSDIGMTAPRSVAVASVADEVRVEVLLALEPAEAS